MGFYAVSTVSLAKSQSPNDPKKVFYADDGSGASKLDKLSDWWRELKVIGPPLGYDVNAGKTWLIVKPAHEERARRLFNDILLLLYIRHPEDAMLRIIQLSSFQVQNSRIPFLPIHSACNSSI